LRDEPIRVSGPTRVYACASKWLGFHFCGAAGCIACWRAMGPGKDGRRRIAVNLRLAEPDAVGAIVIDHFDGLVSFDDLGRDSRAFRICGFSGGSARTPLWTTATSRTDKLARRQERADGV
jgi:hypothetical protein